jgi:hypothetical protein
LKLPVDETAYSTGSVFFRPFQQTGPGWMRLVVRIRLALQVGRYTRTTGWGVHGFDTRGQRLSSRVPAKLQDLAAFQQKFDGSAKSRPELHLSRDRTLHNFACNAGIENEGVGEFDGLTHTFRVA